MLFFLIFGCGPKKPPQPTVPLELINPYENPHPLCDPNAHILAQGFGNTPDEAIKNGQTSISSQIASNLNATTTQLSSSLRSGVTEGKYEKRMVTYEKKLLSSIQSSTSFEHADLMKIVIPPQVVNQNFQTLICLHRGETAGLIVQEIEPDLKAFEMIVGNAIKTIGPLYSPVNKDNISEFTRLFNQALKLHKKLSPRFYEVQSLLGGLDPRQESFNKQWITIKSRATEVMQSVTIGLSLHSLQVGEDEQMIVQEVIRSSISDTGLRVIDAVDCNTNTTYVANVNLKDHCKSPDQTFGMGYMCTPILQIQVEECSSNISTTVALSDKKIKGQDYYTPEKAIASALKKLHGENFMSIFATELGSVLPIKVDVE